MVHQYTDYGGTGPAMSLRTATVWLRGVPTGIVDKYGPQYLTTRQKTGTGFYETTTYVLQYQVPGTYPLRGHKGGTPYGTYFCHGPTEPYRHQFLRQSATLWLLYTTNVASTDSTALHIGYK